MKEAEVLDVGGNDGEEPPSTIVWAMGQTQHYQRQCYRARELHSATCTRQCRCRRAAANIYRGHDNVQGATDVGPNPDSLPGYYGLATGAWKHFAAV